jgi:holo-[acyl-carrier protein] synthase
MPRNNPLDRHKNPASNLSRSGQTRNIPRMQPLMDSAPNLGALEALRGLRVGTDIAQISSVTQSIVQFGDRYLHRIFTTNELAYCLAAPDAVGTAARLAARFAAKESAIKALALSDVGVNWRDLEVVRDSASGQCQIQLHGNAKLAYPHVTQSALSMSHDGDYAIAIYIAIELSEQAERNQETKT